jgi:surface antigen
LTAKRLKYILNQLIFGGRINTPQKGLSGRGKRFTAGAVNKIKNLFKGSHSKVSETATTVHKKTVAFYRRPMKDVSHLSIVLVIIVTLITGLTPFLSDTGNVVIDPFSVDSLNSRYLSSNEKRILEADSVATIASIYSDQMAMDAYNVTEDLYKKQNVVSGGDKYLASLPIISTGGSGGVRNTVTKYVVQDGDTLSGIAVKFNISTDTIRFANKLEDVDSLKPGDTLTILPVSGLIHTVSAGQTIDGIAARYKVSAAMIISQNDLYGEELTAGMQLVIPDAEIPEAAPKPQPQTRIARGNSSTSSISYVQTSSGPNHFPWGWCTWWVAQKRYVPWNGNAWQWYGNAQAYGRSVGRAPVPGAIMVTWESGYGHVAYVESVSGGSFTVSEMNYAGFGRVSSRTISTSSVPLIGFIY